MEIAFSFFFAMSKIKLGYHKTQFKITLQNIPSKRFDNCEIVTVKVVFFEEKNMTDIFSQTTKRIVTYYDASKRFIVLQCLVKTSIISAEKSHKRVKKILKSNFYIPIMTFL